MDASALLKNYGWSGSGSLDSHNGTASRGLSKPLLISKKVDVLGVGLNKHAAVSDQWWMRAYDSGLKELGSGKKSTLAQVREKGMYAGGLYGRFVKGGSEGGTIEEWNRSLKRKREEDGERGSGHESKGKKVKTEDWMRVKKDIGERVKGFAEEARRRGLVPGQAKKAGKYQCVVARYGEDTVLRVFADAGLGNGSGPSKTTAKQQKYLKEKAVRQLKKTAKTFVISQLSPEDRALMQQSDATSSTTRDEKQQAKALAKAEKAAQKAAAKQSKAAQRQRDLEMKAWEKDMTVEEYQAQRKAKKSSKDGSTTKDGSTSKNDSTSELATTPSFVVDTAGDANLAAQPNQVVDSEGNVRYTVVDEIPVPLDPTIWQGIDVKKLPRRVRDARRAYMEQQREIKKGLSVADNGRKSESITRSERKIKNQEALVMQILAKSRSPGGKEKFAIIEGYGKVELVDVALKEKNGMGQGEGGGYTKEEMSRARTVARRVLKEVKRREKREGKGNGKGKGNGRGRRR